MGIVDSINFSCPGCTEVITEQSKAGACEAASHSSISVPPDIAMDIMGNYVYCEGCNKSFVIVIMDEVKTIKLDLDTI